MNSSLTIKEKIEAFHNIAFFLYYLFLSGNASKYYVHC